MNRVTATPDGRRSIARRLFFEGWLRHQKLHELRFREDDTQLVTDEHLSKKTGDDSRSFFQFAIGAGGYALYIFFAVVVCLIIFG
jgi:hypothetical protein